MNRSQVVDNLLAQCKKQDIKEKHIFYFLELLSGINNDSQFSADRIHDVKKFDDPGTGLAVIIKLLCILEDIGNIRTATPVTSTAVNRLLSQLVNIITLSGAIDPRIISYLRHQLKQQKQGIEEKQIFYVLELLRSINSESQFMADWLNNVIEYSKFDTGIPVISELLRLFEEIVNVRENRPLNSAAVNSIVSQLVNISNLSRSDTSNLSNLRYQLLRLQEEYLNPDFINSPAFSQEGEDLVLKRLFPADKQGFFIDVGAHHPTRFSNTYYFYQRGWRGINIDPLPGSMELFKAMRPEDINLQMAVGSGQEGDGTAEYILFEEPAYNCLMRNRQQQTDFQSSRILEKIQIPVKSLDAILEQYAAEFNILDLLSIDVEGYEDEVLAGFSLEKYLPQVIVIEIRGFSLECCNESPLYNYFAGLGYRLRSILFHSLIFQRTDP